MHGCLILLTSERSRDDDGIPADTVDREIGMADHTPWRQQYLSPRFAIIFRGILKIETESQLRQRAFSVYLAAQVGSI
ncbi:MAG: hypothetical protein BWY75_02882 [bacterium ADurb.Bin425]|nr:MAG: hypothetical protein BWY75_02882 [bacterium ADurb.Bin425]